MLTAQQLHKHSVSLFSQLQNTDTYEHLKMLLFAWRDSAKSAPHAISAFLKILQLIAKQTPQLLDDLNRCLLKQYSPDNNTPSLTKVRRLALENSNANNILDQVLTWLRTEHAIPQQIVPPKAPQLQELSQQEFLQRLQLHQRCREISKIIYLYRRCVLTLSEFKRLLEPIYLSDPSFFNMLFQYAEELEAKRRKVTIFAPLNELVDQKYPLEQVGNSYIIIPDGYANWGHNWNKNALETVCNRVCVSVPLGTEGSFVITRKNEFQEQLLRNQEEKYQIDSNLASLSACIRLIEKTKRITHPLVQKILGNIYTGEVMSIMMRSPQAEVARNIVIPRLKQKLMELTRCRTKFEKACQEVAAKNFYKSLDYRCFYFCKNDKKFNCPTRWEKEIQLRKRQITQEQCQGQVLQIEDRQSLQHSRYYVLNSFDNITTQQLLPERKVDLKKNSTVEQTEYPKFPHNQVLFLVDFSDTALLNDVLEVLLYHTQKKSLLQLMIFKLMRVSIERKLQKDSSMLQFIDGRPIENDNFPSNQSLNQIKTNRRVYKDLTDQFLDLIEQDIEPARIEDMKFPFEGPEQQTFIGTKQCYLFIRYLVTIYQRFARAKALSQQKSTKEQPSLYGQFLSVLVHKIKQQKGLEEYLRRIFQQDAFIFFTLDKLVLGLVKLINNINVDSLTYKLLKEGVRDYDMEIRRWQDYPHPSVTDQLTRLYRESQMLFRFTYASKDQLFYISAWENGVTNEDKKKKEGMDRSLSPFLNSFEKVEKGKDINCLQISLNEYLHDESGVLVMLGEEGLLRKRRGSSLKQWQKQLSRSKRLKIL